MRKADIPSPIVSGTCTAIGSEIYLVSGSMWKYDIGTDTWSACFDPPTELYYATLISSGGMIYIMGGTTTGEYDPLTDTWTQKTDMPTYRHWPDIVEVAGRLYVLGGKSLGGDFVHAVEEYDPATDQWTARAGAVLIPTYSPSAFAVGGKIYQLSYEGKIAEYDPVADTWSLKAKCPTQLLSTRPQRFVQAGGKIYVVGGYFYQTVTEKR